MIGFAHRGAKAYAPENTIDAFTLALRLGANGLESDVWLTADGVPVLDHDGVLKRGLRRTKIGSLVRSQVPVEIPSLVELLAVVPSRVPLSLDIKDPAAFIPVCAAYAACPDRSPMDLYLCHTDADVLHQAKATNDGFRPVHSVRLAAMKNGPERHAARLRELGVEVVNMPFPDWTGGLVALFRRFGLLCFAWDCQHHRQLSDIAAMGIDAVYSDWPDRIADVLRIG